MLLAETGMQPAAWSAPWPWVGMAFPALIFLFASLEWFLNGVTWCLQVFGYSRRTQQVVSLVSGTALSIIFGISAAALGAVLTSRQGGAEPPDGLIGAAAFCGLAFGLPLVCLRFLNWDRGLRNPSP